MTRRLTAVLGIAVVSLTAGATGCSGAKQASRPGPRVIVLGFDGLDYSLTRELMARGRMPNFSRLAATTGRFGPLETSLPPQSPVAWSSFATGGDPGLTGIFDFIHRDPQTLIPYLSTSRVEPGRYTLALGRWQLPLVPARMTLLRQGRPFWAELESRGVQTTIMRMPANFPPSGAASRELSGMGTPDVLGTYGTFSYFTSDPRFRTGPLGGGTVQRVDATGGLVRGVLEGPAQTFLTRPERMHAEFTATIDSTRRFVKLTVNGHVRLLAVGEWSDWVPIAFEAEPFGQVAAEARFFVKSLDPYFGLYVSPLNFDPMDPPDRISTPGAFATELAHATGRFYTQGMPEDTKALKAGVLTVDEFLEQAALAQRENLQQYRYLLARLDRGLLFHYFGGVDQVSHMVWRSMDPDHPGYDPASDPKYAHVVPDLYASADDIVGETLASLRDGDLLVVMSDHGFASWRRAFNLNSWLRANRYLALDAGAPSSSLFENADWERTRAYGLGLNGLYLNLRGREAFGSVEPADREALLVELSDKLLHLTDPATGQPVVARVYRPDHVFHGRALERSPDLIVGYAKGVRVSDESALGEVADDMLTDNLDAWSGDHCMDPAAVPGVLLTNRSLRMSPSSLQALAPAILAGLNVTGFGGQ